MTAGIGIAPSLGLSVVEQRELVQEVARLGYDSLWTPAGLTAQSIFQTCHQWWLATTQVVADGLSVGTSVIPFPGWTVPPLAAESATLSEITGGKFNLGIGLGAYPSEALRHQLGLPLISPLSFTRDFLIPVRGLCPPKPVAYPRQPVTSRGV